MLSLLLLMLTFAPIVASTGFDISLWYVGGFSQSCDSVCSGKGGVNEAQESTLDTQGKIDSVVAKAGYYCLKYFQLTDGEPPILETYGGRGCWYLSPGTKLSPTWSTWQSRSWNNRICACGLSPQLSLQPSSKPSLQPTTLPSFVPSASPTKPTFAPSAKPTFSPSPNPTSSPTFSPTKDTSLDDEIIVSIHGSNFDDKGYGIVVDNDENIYTTGLISKNGIPSAFLRKSNSNLEEIFLDILYDPLKTSIGNAITINGNYVYITGVYDSQILLMKYSIKSSTPEYVLNNFGRGTAYAIATDSTDSVHITGSFDNNSIFLKKISSRGNEIFSKVYGLGSGLGITVFGLNIYTTGSLISSGGDSDVFLSKYDMNGDELFTKVSATPFEDVGTGLTVDSQGFIYLTGYTEGNLDGELNNGMKDSFLMKYTPEGEKLFTELSGSFNNDISNAVFYSGFENKIYVTGSTKGKLNDDIFLQSYSTDGQEIAYLKKGLPSGDDSGQSLFCYQNQVYIHGFSSFPTTQYEKFDGQRGIGGTDVSIVKYTSPIVYPTHIVSVVPVYLIVIIVVYLVAACWSSIVIIKGADNTREVIRGRIMKSSGEKICLMTVFLLSSFADFITDSLFVKQVHNDVDTSSFDERSVNSRFLVASAIFLIVPVVANLSLIIRYGEAKLFASGILHFLDRSNSQESNGCIYNITIEPLNIWYCWAGENSYSHNSLLCNYFNSVLFFLYPIHVALGIALYIFINLLMYLIVLSNTELAYIMFGKPENYFKMTCMGVWIEDIPQFLLQLSYCIMMIQFNHKVSNIQIASLIITFWHFGFSTTLKYMKREEKDWPSSTDSALNVIDSAGSIQIQV